MHNLARYPDKIKRLLESIYSATFSAVRVGADLPEWFETIIGVLQGCLQLSPLLFSIFLEVIMAIVLDKLDVGAVLNGHVSRTILQPQQKVRLTCKGWLAP